MYERYEELLKINNVTTAEVCRATGIAQSTMSNWKKRRNAISIKNARLIAKFFNVPLEYLTGDDPDAISFEKDKIIRAYHSGYYEDETVAKEAQEMFDDPDMRSLFHMKRNMSPEKFKAHVNMMKELYRLEHPEDDDYGA